MHIDAAACSEAIRLEAERRLKMSPLEIAQEKLKGVDLGAADVHTLLLLDIAISLRELQHLSRAGLEFSKGLADKFD